MLTYEQVLEKLLILETLGLAKDIEKAVIRVWLSLMNAEGVTAQEWGAAISKVARTKTFQVKPVEVLEVVHEIREAARAYALNTVDHVEAFDSRGYMILAPYNRVKDGFLRGAFVRRASEAITLRHFEKVSSVFEGVNCFFYACHKIELKI